MIPERSRFWQDWRVSAGQIIPRGEPALTFKALNRGRLQGRRAICELFRLSGRYVEKRKGLSRLVITRQPGDLVFFEDAIGFRSQAHNPHLRPDKAVFIQDGYFVA